MNLEAFDWEGDVPVLVDWHRSIMDVSGINVFIAEGGRLATPSQGLLDGMTLRTVFDVCAELRLICIGESINLERLRPADELFATSTAEGIMPISEVDGRFIGACFSSPIAERLRAVYWARKEEGWLATPFKYEVYGSIAGAHS